MASPAQSISQVVEPLVTAAGLEMWDVEVNPRAVRILVDRPGGVDLESITNLARVVSAELDGREDLTPGSQYHLEVSSPGVERPLRTPGHYQRFIGSVINVKTEAPIDGSRRLQGVLLAADEAAITIDLPEGPSQLTYDHIQKARTVLMWGPQAKAPHRERRSTMKDAAR